MRLDTLLLRLSRALLLPVNESMVEWRGAWLAGGARELTRFHARGGCQEAREPADSTPRFFAQPRVGPGKQFRWRDGEDGPDYRSLKSPGAAPGEPVHAGGDVGAERGGAESRRTEPLDATGAEVFVAFGANLGDPVRQIARAVEALRDRVRWERISSVYRTRPEGYADQPDFYNLVASGPADLSAPGLLAEFRAVEREIGRAPTFRNGPRAIDIDLLAYGSEVLADEGLSVPHPRLHRRAFVLVPLVEIAPEWVHPVLESTADELLGRLGQPVGVEPWGPLPRSAT